MGRVVHFEIHAEDPERARAFYEAVFGWTLQKWAGPAEYWLIVTGADNQPGINGGLLRRQGSPPAADQPVSSFVCSVEVDSVDDAVSRATAAGGTVAVPKMAVPGVAWLAYIKDTEGNVLGVTEPDTAAA